MDWCSALRQACAHDHEVRLIRRFPFPSPAATSSHFGCAGNSFLNPRGKGRGGTPPPISSHRWCQHRRDSDIREAGLSRRRCSRSRARSWRAPRATLPSLPRSVPACSTWSSVQRHGGPLSRLTQGVVVQGEGSRLYGDRLGLILPRTATRTLAGDHLAAATMTAPHPRARRSSAPAGCSRTGQSTHSALAASTSAGTQRRKIGLGAAGDLDSLNHGDRTDASIGVLLKFSFWFSTR